MTDQPRLGGLLARWASELRIPKRGQRIVVGCSGGTDSLALLALTCAAGFDVVAVHVDHGLRPQSGSEFSAVRHAASRFGAAAVDLAIDVPPGPGVEARARHARLAVLEEQRRAVGADAIALGHTRDDQAETVLLNALRGAAGPGLAGIPPVRGAILHPILTLSRADTAEICALLRLEPIHDPMNDDPSFRRVWLRREVIPLLEAGTGQDLREVLARQAAVLRDESDFLDDLAAERLAAAAASESDGLPVEALREVDAAVARRMVRIWVGTPPPSLAEVEGVLAIARGERAAAEISGHGRVERARGRLYLVGRAPAALADFELPLPGAAEGSGWRFESWVERGAPVSWPDGRYTCVLDADVVGDVALVRRAEPGERLQPLGMTGTKTVGSVLADAGVPRTARATRPVVATAAGTPLWVVGYRVGDHARVTATTERFLWVRAEHRATCSPGDTWR